MLKSVKKFVKVVFTVIIIVLLGYLIGQCFIKVIANGFLELNYIYNVLVPNLPSAEGWIKWGAEAERVQSLIASCIFQIIWGFTVIIFLVFLIYNGVFKLVNIFLGNDEDPEKIDDYE